MTSFEDLWARLGVRDKTAKLPVDATSTGRTFRMATPVPVAPDPGSLPVIPLGGAGRGASAAGEPPSDLAITGILGEGAMGRVHVARQRSLGRDVAVKVVKPGTDGADEALFREAAFMGLLEHPSVIPVHALGRDAKGKPILVMKKVEGVSWSELLKDPSHPSWGRIDGANGDRLVAHLGILSQVCNALELAHRRGVIHRDVKPSNVMVGEFGEVYLVDFGIARRVDRATATAEDEIILGTPAYMAPEMVACDLASIGPRTDVYLLGATLHQVLTGTFRHTGDDVASMLLAALAPCPVEYDAGVPDELAAICNKATSKAPADRHASALEFRLAIADYLRHRGSLALAREAEKRLADVDEALGHTSPDAHALVSAMTESRFGFTQALREWSDNTRARVGLGRCLERMIEHELHLRNARGARALLVELGANETSAADDARRADLDRRVSTLERELRDEAARAGRLETFERDLDVSVAARPRAVFFGLLGLLSIGLITQLILGNGDLTRFSYEEILAEGGGAFLLISLSVVVFRKRLLANAMSGRVVAAALAATFIMLVARVAGMVAGEPLRFVLLGDLLIFLTMVAMVGIAIERRFLWVAPLLLAFLLVAVLVPPLSGVAWALGVFTISLAAGLVGFAPPRPLHRQGLGRGQLG